MGFTEAVFTLGEGGSQDEDQLEEGEEGGGQHGQPRSILQPITLSCPLQSLWSVRTIKLWGLSLILYPLLAMVCSLLAPVRSVAYLLEVRGFTKAVFTLGEGRPGRGPA